MKHLIKEILKEEFLYKGVNPTVDLIVTRGDEILLIKRGSGSDAEPNKWALPGGFHDSNAKKGEEWVNNKETTLQAAKREVKEETGLEVDKIDGLKFYFVGVFEGGDRDPRDNEDSWTKSTVYKVDIPKEFGDDIKGMDDASKARWVPINIVLNSDLAFDHRDIIKKGLNQNLNESDDFDWMEEIPGEAGYGTRYKFFEIHVCYEIDANWTLDNPEGTDECVESLITYIKIEESLADEIWSGYEGYTAGPVDDGEGVIDYAIKNTKGNNFKEAIMVEYVKEINMENFCVAVGKEKENRKVCEIYNKYPYTNIDYFNESESNRSDFDWVDDIGEEFPLELLKPGQKFKDKWGDYIRIWEYEGQGLPIGPNDVPVDYGNILKFKIIEDPSNYRPYPKYPKKHSLNSGIIINKKDFKKHIRTGKLTPIFDNSVR